MSTVLSVAALGLGWVGAVSAEAMPAYSAASVHSPGVLRTARLQ
jgi:hypothetical protein